MTTEHPEAHRDGDPTATAASLCWACHHAIHAEHFCPSCAKVQPLPGGLDFFELLGFLPRLSLDEKELERRFYALSRELHPDFFQQNTDSERKISLERFAAINQAYHALRDLWGRAGYLLELFHRHVNADKSRQGAPKSLLMTVMELQEATEEISHLGPQASERERQAAAGRLREIEHEIDEKENESEARLHEVAARWDEVQEAGGDPQTTARLLDGIQNLINEKTYLKRLRSNIAQVLGQDA